MIAVELAFFALFAGVGIGIVGGLSIKVTGLKRKLREPWYVAGVVHRKNGLTAPGAFGPFHSRWAAWKFHRRYSQMYEAALTITRGNLEEVER